ncbi:MAG TPA: hypothetical protein VGP28_05735, partial [Methylocella sp.]|nr:hypothetical protein [Methylocella sp.]
MIKRTRRHLFILMTNGAIPATNNGSPASRPRATFPKITHGLRRMGCETLRRHRLRPVRVAGRRRPERLIRSLVGCGSARSLLSPAEGSSSPDPYGCLNIRF